ncbi:ATP-binding protein [Streptomyces griseus]|uniref:ATP-binding protein n=3 Tax=Streptomyces TaxID=1883 RepID=A0ABU2W700_9ACTN|nr:ATP-binding protein [Streptomyces griseus]MDT0493646.1 ATP-binding protein [Streptomyces griseus]
MSITLDDTLVHCLEDRLSVLLNQQRSSELSAEGKFEIKRITAALSGRPGPPPRALLMSGLQGAGKTTLARALERSGFRRLCPDEEMFRRHGHYGKDFPRGEFRVREAPILLDIAREFRRLLQNGHDVVLDHGLWTPEERGQWAATAMEVGGQPVLIYLPESHEVRWSRIQKRNEQSLVDANSIEFSESDLLRHADRFIPPSNDEPHIVYEGRPDEILDLILPAGGGHHED